MNRTTKKFLIAGTVLCGAGLIIFGAGALTGGKKYVATADLNVISGDATLLSNDNHAILEKTELDSFSQVNADLRNIDFNVEPSSDDKFYISYNIETSDGLLPLSYQVSEDGALNIAESQGNSSSSYIHIDINFLQMMLGQTSVVENVNQATLYIPQNQKLDSFFCRMGDGYLNINTLDCQNMSLSDDYGDITLKNLDISKGTVTSSDGDISIKDSLLRNTSVQADYGNINIQNTSCNNGELKLSDGDLTTATASFSGQNTIDSSLGDITLGISADNLKQLSINASTSLGDLNIPDSLEGTSTGSDDLTTYSRTTDSKNLLTVTSSDGDISISSK